MSFSVRVARTKAIAIFIAKGNALSAIYGANPPACQSESAGKSGKWGICLVFLQPLTLYGKLVDDFAYSSQSFL